MKKRLVHLLAFLVLGISVSCGAIGEPSRSGSASLDPERGAARHRVAFEDRTVEIVDHAEKLIEKNEREGAVLDQKWYGFRRFGKYQDLFLGAELVLFYGGVEAEVRSHIEGQYLTLVPLDDNADPGEIRLFAGQLPRNRWDYIIIGQNGREVALKTVIRLIYMAKFADDEMKRKHRGRLQAFSNSLRVFMSPVSAQDEYVNFFRKHGIQDPDVVVIGFMGDASAVMRAAGFERPPARSDESLRVLWYPNVNGKKLLLVSINGNRIFASRAAGFIEGLYAISPNSRFSLAFLGSGGAVDRPEMVGRIVAPTSVTDGNPFPGAKERGEVVHLIRNRAADLAPLPAVHASVESVVVETMEWAKDMKRRRVDTVDQELYHIIDAVHSSARARETPIYVGIVVTDDVSDDRSATEVTLQHAEEIIAETTESRKEFLLSVFKRTGILPDADQDAVPQAGRRAAMPRGRQK